MQVQATPSAAAQVPYKFVNSLAATYMVSVVSASTAELHIVTRSALIDKTSIFTLGKAKNRFWPKWRYALSHFHLLVTYPLDLTKTRLQIQGEIAAGKEGVSS
ncbi:unnamed protein product, partial [Nesidiocoris tenuis]